MLLRALRRGCPILILVAALAAQSSQEDPPRGWTWSVQGRVVDAEGKPIAGVGLAFAAHEQLLTADALERPQAKSAADGTFAVRVPLGREQPLAPITTLLLAAPGKAAARWQPTDWTPYRLDGAQVDLGDIVLPEGVELMGRVLGKDGKPVAGARLTALDLMRNRPGPMAPWHAPVVLASCAATDADGCFALAGAMPEAVEILVGAEGHYRRRLSPVSKGEPLVIELEASGAVGGRVVRSGGKPGPCSLLVHYETAKSEPDRHHVQVEKSGRFQTTLRHPGRYRLFAYGIHASGASPVLSGAAQDVEVHLDRELVELSVGAIDATTGAAIDKLRVLSWRLQSDGKGPFYLRASDQMWDWDEELAPDGRWRLTVPRGAGKVALRLSIEGRAPCTIPGIDLGQQGEIRVEARVGRESVIEGRVVAEKAGEPVADLPLRYRSAEEIYLQQRPHRHRTSADGAFRIGGLGKGKYELLVDDPRIPDAARLVVTLGEEETKKDVVVTRPAGAVLSGKLTGAAIGSGWRLRLYSSEGPVPPYEWWQVTDSCDGRDEGRVGADGSYRFERQLPGNRQMHLVIPAMPRAGAEIVVQLPPLRLSKTDVERDIDLAGKLPATICGKVTLRGADPRAGRFLVSAKPVQSDGRFGGLYTWLAWTERCGLIAADGSYTLSVAPGEHWLRIVDVETGVVLHEESVPLDAKGGETVGKDFACAVVPVTARLERAGKAPMGAAWLGIRTATTVKKPKLAGEPLSKNEGYLLASVSLLGGLPEVSFFVPPGAVQLTVFSNSRWLQGTNEGEPVSLGQADLDASLDKPAPVVIQVADPPPIEVRKR